MIRPTNVELLILGTLLGIRATAKICDSAAHPGEFGGV